MKIALAQLNFTVGDFDLNARKIIDRVRHASSQGADLILFSELSVCGYPPLDLLERDAFVRRSLETVEHIAREVPPGIGVIVGAPGFNPNEEGKHLFNCAYFLHEGEPRNVFRKCLLPTYDIFDEYRYFEPNTRPGILEFKGKKIAVTICEDLWDDLPPESRSTRTRLYPLHPLEEVMDRRPDFVVNISASPFAHSRQQLKRKIFIDKAKKHRIPVFMVNQVGANTELIFEGGSLAATPNGGLYRQMEFFKEDYALFDLEDVVTSVTGAQPSLPERIELMYRGLITGIRDYFLKSGFSKATLGLSGGIDSAVTMALASEALGPENLHVLLMPSQYSSSHSIEDAEKLVQNLGTEATIIPISSLFDRFRESLKPLFGNRPEDVTEENIQSRIRGTLLMALSNKSGNILLNTSNKSETAVGYGTLYGDMAGGLSVLGDVYKTDVYALANFINRNTEVIPENIIRKPPSAELRPEQKDSDSLPEYELLDRLLELYIEYQYSAEQIIGEGFDGALVRNVIRMVNVNEYKRYQTPPILRISSKAFGDGRRIPIVAKY